MVVLVTRARRSAHRRISVFMARRGGVIVNKRLCALAVVDGAASCEAFS